MLIVTCIKKKKKEETTKQSKTKQNNKKSSTRLTDFELLCELWDCRVSIIQPSAIYDVYHFNSTNSNNLMTIMPVADGVHLYDFLHWLRASFVNHHLNYHLITNFVIVILTPNHHHRHESGNIRDGKWKMEAD